MSSISRKPSRSPALLLAVLAAIVGGTAAAQTAGPAPAAVPVHGKIRVVRLDAPAATWADVSTQLMLPVGARVGLEYELDQPHLVTWTGAKLTELGNYSSRAEFDAADLGSQDVSIEAVDPAGPRIERTHQCVEVVSVAEFTWLLAQGVVDISGRMIAADPREGGHTEDAIWTHWYHWLSATWIVSGGLGGGTSGGPFKPCFDNCTLDASTVPGNPSPWSVYVVIHNNSSCDTSYYLFGTTASGEKWTLAPLNLVYNQPYSTGLIPAHGAKAFYVTVSFETVPPTLPSGHQYFTLYSLGSHTPVMSGAPLPFNCSAQVSGIDVCLDCSGT
jgi:hypothetical protein